MNIISLPPHSQSKMLYSGSVFFMCQEMPFSEIISEGFECSFYFYFYFLFFLYFIYSKIFPKEWRNGIVFLFDWLADMGFCGMFLVREKLYFCFRAAETHKWWILLLNITMAFLKNAHTIFKDDFCNVKAGGSKFLRFEPSLFSNCSLPT